MKYRRWGKFFINSDGIENLYLIPTFVWSKKYRIFALIWIRTKFGVLL